MCICLNLSTINQRPQQYYARLKKLLSHDLSCSYHKSPAIRNRHLSDSRNMLLALARQHPDRTCLPYHQCDLLLDFSSYVNLQIETYNFPVHSLLPTPSQVPGR
jgi:hypothetical protein